ncbi:MAG: TolC family protein [Fuerstiella sp.]
MRTNTMKAWFLGGLICLSGCSGLRNTVANRDSHRPARPTNPLDLPNSQLQMDDEFAFGSQSPIAGSQLANDSTPAVAGEIDSIPQTGGHASNTANASMQKQPATSHYSTITENARPQKLTILPVGLEVADDGPENGGRITIDGRNYEIRLVDQAADGNSGRSLRKVHLASQRSSLPEHQYEQATPLESISAPEIVTNNAVPDAILLNLPSALSMVGRDHPAVGFAQWKVQEAYANLEQAEVLWLPNIQTGYSFHRHDGNYQASNGDIVDVNRSSFQYGLGAGATGAGTTPNPGIRAQFHLADAIFQPDIAQKTAWATCHAEKAVVNKQLRDVALAYMKLLDAHQQLRILEEVRNKTASLSQITDDFAAAGQGLQADTDRMQTELALIEGRIAEAREIADVASARLAYAVSAEPGRKILPIDPTVVPIELVTSEIDQGSLISTGLSNRPELKELQALVSAACDQYQRQKYAPFVPSVLLGLSGGGFGGGRGSSINNVNNRCDFDAMVTWEIRNFGFGERSARRRTEAQVQQAMYRKVSLIDDVAREIAEAHTQVTHRRERMAITQLSIQSAQDSYDHDLSRIREGQGLPIEVLQSVKALEASRRAYLESVIAYNEAQFQLQWALGWQVTAPQ